MIEMWAVSPRLRDQAPDDVFDVKSSGLDLVGINQRVYLLSVPKGDYARSITDYAWSVVAEPSPGAAAIDSNTSGLLKFHPSAGGQSRVQLVPWVQGAATTPPTQRIFAAKSVGSGTEGSNTPLPPMCGFSSCHGDAAALSSGYAWPASTAKSLSGRKTGTSYLWFIRLNDTHAAERSGSVV